MFKFFSIITILGLALLILPVQKVKAADTIDRSCNAAASPLTASIGSGSWQTFTPSQNRLSKISVDVFRNGNNGNVMVGVTLKVSHDLGRSSVVVDAGSKKVALGGATLVYDFTDIEVTPGDPYRITLTTTGDVSWREQDDLCYRGGDAYQNSKITDPRFDYGFATYGYTVEDNPPVSANNLDDIADQNNPPADNNQANSTTTNDSSLSDIATSNPTNPAKTSVDPKKPSNIVKKTTKPIVNLVESLKEKPDLTIWYVIGAAGLGVLIAVGLFIYLKIKKKKEREP